MENILNCLSFQNSQGGTTVLQNILGDTVINETMGNPEVGTGTACVPNNYKGS